jgi:hypothetical protein
MDEAGDLEERVDVPEERRVVIKDTVLDPGNGGVKDLSSSCKVDRYSSLSFILISFSVEESP